MENLEVIPKMCADCCSLALSLANEGTAAGLIYRAAESLTRFPTALTLATAPCRLRGFVNGVASRIALWTQAARKELQCLLGRSKLSSFSELFDASGLNGLASRQRFGLQNS